MLKDPIDHVGNGLEAAMRMPRRPLGLARGVLNLAHLVHVDEGVEVGQRCPGEGAPDGKALSLESRRSVGDALHLSEPRRGLRRRYSGQRQVVWNGHSGHRHSILVTERGQHRFGLFCSGDGPPRSGGAVDRDRGDPYVAVISRAVLRPRRAGWWYQRAASLAAPCIPGALVQRIYPQWWLLDPLHGFGPLRRLDELDVTGEHEGGHPLREELVQPGVGDLSILMEHDADLHLVFPVLGGHPYGGRL